jgi:hypothetical protein
MTGFQSKKLVARMTPSSKIQSKPFKIIDTATVDDAQWYTIRVWDHSCARWVRKCNKAQWFELTASSSAGSLFDMHEKLYTMLALKWSQ